MTADQIQLAQENLLQAAARGDVLRMRSALVAGAALDGQRHGMGDTALLLAVAMGQESAVVFLLDGGANPDIQNATGRTALHEATFLNSPNIWNHLVKAGARTDIVSVDRHTPLTLKDSLAFGASMVTYAQEQAQQAMGQRSGDRDNSRGR
jgi:ankyrin repeat protein